MGSQSSFHRNKNKRLSPEIELDLPKCKHPITIYTELTKLYSSEDYWGFARKLFGQQPLSGLVQHQENLQARITDVKSGIADYHNYIKSLVIEHPGLYCKQGFSELAYAGFAKYNDPERFEIVKDKFEQDSKTPCAAFEEQTLCSALPEDVSYMGLLTKFQAGIEFNHG